jgi:hypothetical protein
MHDITDPGEPSRRLMVVNAPDNQRKSILAALKSGCAHGVEIRLPQNETFIGKELRLDSLPEVNSVTMKGDTLDVEFNQKALVIRFYGQHGNLLGRNYLDNKARYIVKPEDTYVRTVAIYSTPSDREGITLFLNPVFRTKDGKKPEMTAAVVDTYSTWVYRIVGFASVIFIMVNIVYLRRRARQRRKRSGKA